MKRLIFLAIIFIFGCNSNNDTAKKVGLDKDTGKYKVSELAVISTRYGDIVVEFFPNTAPLHVESFLDHARRGYFDGTTFHRVIPGFVIQGGDPNSRDDDRSNDGWGGNAAHYYGVGSPDTVATWMLPPEFSDRPHVRGALSMARAREFDSAGSQFFICVDDVRRLDTRYSVFGRVIQGMEVVDAIAYTERDSLDNPLEKVTMTAKVIQRQNI